MAKGQRMDKELAQYALQGIEAAIEKLQRQAAELRRWAGRSSGRTALSATHEQRQRGVGETAAAQDAGEVRQARQKRRTMSAAARKRISDAQKARWAKVKRKKA